jgi:hypothetical protein
MSHTLTRGRWQVVLLVFLLGSAGSISAVQNKDEEQVRQVFTNFQETLKKALKKDATPAERTEQAARLWPLLDEDSQADAERVARSIRNAYAKAAPAEKAEQEKALGLPGEKLAALKGQDFLATKRFLGKYDEVPDGKIDKVTVQGDKATVNYTEPDGDKEKLALVRQAGQWKLTVPMPKGK